MQKNKPQNIDPIIIQNFNDLIEALNQGRKNIIIKRSFVCTYSIILPEDVKIKGEIQENGELPLISFIDTDGFGVSSNNEITDLNIDTAAQKKLYIQPLTLKI